MLGIHVITQSMLLQLIAATTSQFMSPQGFPPYFNQGAQMAHMGQMPQMNPMGQMAQMPMLMANGQPPATLPNASPLMSMGHASPMMPHLPRLPGMPASMPAPLQLPMPFGMGGARLPMVVMPHYNKKADKPKKKARKAKTRRRLIESSSNEDSCSESEFEYRSKNKLRGVKKRREVLTPVVSYVTKDGYVVYQKKIKKEKAKDWLDLAKPASGEKEKPNKQD